MIVHIVDVRTVTTSVADVVVVTSEQTTTHWNDVASRPRSRQQILYGDVQDVSGASIVKREPVSALQLQGVEPWESLKTR